MDDIPSPANCLYGSFICSTKPLARVKGIKFQPKPYPDGLAAVITYKDIPTGGENIGSKTIFGTEPLFAEELTECAGQRLAFLVILLFLSRNTWSSFPLIVNVYTSEIIYKCIYFLFEVSA